MARYRDNLPFDKKRFFLTDGGMETEFIYKKGIELPHFAAFKLLENNDNKAAVEHYFRDYFNLAKAYDAGFILGGFTWRANNDWGPKLGYNTPQAVNRLIKDIINYLADLRAKYETTDMPIILSGSMGNRGDGYDPGKLMTAHQAEQYHNIQIKSFVESDVDIISALTLNNSIEAIGIVRAARKHNMPIAVSFTVETDGNLPTGQSLQDAIEKVEQATDGYPLYYMVNCAHPSHFSHLLTTGENWTRRVRGIRANASRCSHADLDKSTELDDGNPVEFGVEYQEILSQNPQINIIGGCCGTDHRHVEAAIKSCSA